eukprot:TRINITY_DN14992_c0_g1_i1.p1 TRINITY_DN14992_c0_g1~~TRINITY_DN14992_c0_g1_i1.p1  ORF type:complete len:398 (-),score=19.19 TRINITY_DN14992_c0_g1_i1:21-1214(-)
MAGEGIAATYSNGEEQTRFLDAAPSQEDMDCSEFLACAQTHEHTSCGIGHGNVRSSCERVRSTYPRVAWMIGSFILSTILLSVKNPNDQRQTLLRGSPSRLFSGNLTSTGHLDDTMELHSKSSSCVRNPAPSCACNRWEGKDGVISKIGLGKEDSGLPGAEHWFIVLDTTGGTYRTELVPSGKDFGMVTFFTNQKLQESNLNQLSFYSSVAISCSNWIHGHALHETAHAKSWPRDDGSHSRMSMSDFVEFQKSYQGSFYSLFQFTGPNCQSFARDLFYAVSGETLTTQMDADNLHNAGPILFLLKSGMYLVISISLFFGGLLVNILMIFLWSLLLICSYPICILTCGKVQLLHYVACCPLSSDGTCVTCFSHDVPTCYHCGNHCCNGCTCCRHCCGY